MKEKLSKSSVGFIVMVAALGILTVVRTASIAVIYFNLPLLIVNLLETVCFAWTLYYALCPAAKSSTFFKVTLISLAATYAMIAALDPQDTNLPHTYSLPLLSFFIVAGLTVILCKWNDFGLCKKVAWGVIIASLAIAVITTVLPLDIADPGEFEEPVLQILAGVYTPPLITICILGSYLSRMEKKADEEPKTT